MINVLYALNASFHMGGTENVVLNLYDHLDRSKYRIDFLIHGHESECRDNEIQNDLLKKGSKIYYVTPRGESYIDNQKDIKRVLKENAYDIVHSHMDAAGYFLLKEAKKAKVPLCISHSHSTGLPIESIKGIKKCCYSFILNYARKKIPSVTDIRIACSIESGKWLFDKTDFTVLYNAIDIEKFRYQMKVRDRLRGELNISNDIVFGHVGRFTPEKNHAFLINLFSEIRKRHENVKLILVGSGAMQETVSAQIWDLGLDKDVLMLEQRSDVSELLQAFDMFLLPSLREGLPISAIEAQATGLPCVMSDTISSEVILSDNAKQLPLDAPLSVWCDCIDGLLNSNIDRNNGVSITRKAGYDINEVAARLATIYDDGLAKKKIR